MLGIEYGISAKHLLISQVTYKAYTAVLALTNEIHRNFIYNDENDSTLVDISFL